MINLKSEQGILFSLNKQIPVALIVATYLPPSKGGIISLLQIVINNKIKQA